MGKLQQGTPYSLGECNKAPLPKPHTGAGLSACSPRPGLGPWLWATAAIPQAGEKDTLKLLGGFLVKKKIILTKLVKLNKSKTIGEKLRELREAQELSLSHVADRLNVDISFLSRVEHGIKQATRQQIIQLSQILETDEKELLIEYLSDKLVYEVRNEDLAVDAIKAAEQKIEYLQKINRLI